MSEEFFEKRSPIEQIRGQASAAFNLEMAEKAHAVRACVLNGIALGMDEREIFRLSYGDESGAEYWKAFLDQPIDEAELVRALASHLASLLNYLNAPSAAENFKQRSFDTPAPKKIKRRPGPKPVMSDRLKNAMRVWTADNGLEALRDLGLEEAMCIFDSKKNLTWTSLEEIRGEFGVRGW